MGGQTHAGIILTPIGVGGIISLFWYMAPFEITIIESHLVYPLYQSYTSTTDVVLSVRTWEMEFGRCVGRVCDGRCIAFAIYLYSTTCHGNDTITFT